MKRVKFWVILAVVCTLVTGAAIIAALSHSSSDDRMTSELARQQAMLFQRWEWIAIAAEVVAFALWMKTAHRWNTNKPTSKPWVRYVVMFFVAVAATPCAVLVFYAIPIF